MGFFGIDYAAWRKQDASDKTIPMLAKTPRETIDDLLFLAYKCRKKRFQERKHSPYNSELEDRIDSLIMHYLDEPNEARLEEIKENLRRWI